MAQQWFYSRDGKSRFGPVSSTELRVLAQSGQLLSTDQVWQPGMKQWRPASAIKGLFANPTPTPSIPPPLSFAHPPAAIDSLPADHQNVRPHPSYIGLVFGVIGAGFLIVALFSPLLRHDFEHITLLDFCTKFFLIGIAEEKLFAYVALGLLLFAVVVTLICSICRLYHWLRWSDGLAMTSITICAGRVYLATRARVEKNDDVMALFADWSWGWIMLLAGVLFIFIASLCPRNAYRNFD